MLLYHGRTKGHLLLETPCIFGATFLHKKSPKCDAFQTLGAKLLRKKEIINSMESENDLTFVPWSAFESLACWFNRKIAGEETENFRNFEEADVQTFSDIFDKLSAQGISDPADLYRQGVLEYLKTED